MRCPRAVEGAHTRPYSRCKGVVLSLWEPTGKLVRCTAQTGSLGAGHRRLCTSSSEVPGGESAARKGSANGSLPGTARAIPSALSLQKAASLLYAESGTRSGAKPSNSSLSSVAYSLVLKHPPVCWRRALSPERQLARAVDTGRTEDPGGVVGTSRGSGVQNCCTRRT